MTAKRPWPWQIPQVVPTATAQKNRKAQRDGDHAEQLVRSRLSWFGIPFVQRIHTGWKIIRVRGRVVDARPCARVAGDFWGVMPDGRCLLVEVKERDAAKLSLSDLEDHQIQALDAVRRAGGVAILAWVTLEGDCWLMDWPIIGLVKGHPLAKDTAIILDSQSTLRSTTAGCRHAQAAEALETSPAPVRSRSAMDQTRQSILHGGSFHRR